MSTASLITRNLAAKGIERKVPGAIYLVLMDGPRTVCMTEAALDTWWSNLSPEEKAEICEEHHDGPSEADVVDQQRPAPEMCQLRGGVAEFLNRVDTAEMSFDDLFHRPNSRYAQELWAPEKEAS